MRLVQLNSNEFCAFNDPYIFFLFGCQTFGLSLLGLAVQRTDLPIHTTQWLWFPPALSYTEK